MLDDLPFASTARVANKGTDAVLVVRPEHTETAVRAARRCGVRGISTAVLETTGPLDRKTLDYFCTLTRTLVFSDQALLNAQTIPADTNAAVARGSSEMAFADSVAALRALTMKRKQVW